MTTLKPFLDFLIKNHNLSYYKYNTDNYLHLPTSIKLEMIYNGHSYESWGVARNEDLAFFKALMEIIERVILSASCSIKYKSNFLSSFSVSEISQKYAIKTNHLIPNNSNGLAISVVSRRARKSAFLELLERHTLLSALYLNISPEKIVVPKIINIPDIEGHKLDFFYWKVQNHYVVLAVDCLVNGGYLFTHSCNDNLLEGIQKAFEEMVPNIIHFDKHVVNSENSKKYYEIKKDDIESFGLFWKYNPSKEIEGFLAGNSKNRLITIPNLKDVYYSSCYIPQIFENIGHKLYCFRAISPQAQQLFFDQWHEKYINPTILNYGALPTFPHFIS